VSAHAGLTDRLSERGVLDRFVADVRAGQGSYGAADRASAVDEVVISPWALYELVEAAVRSNQREAARAAADQLSRLAEASGTSWARGAAARSRALVSGGYAAEEEYREAIKLLGNTRMATQARRCASAATTPAPT
jgi:hypothetical protein